MDIFVLVAKLIINLFAILIQTVGIEPIRIYEAQILSNRYNNLCVIPPVWHATLSSPSLTAWHAPQGLPLLLVLASAKLLGTPAVLSVSVALCSFCFKAYLSNFWLFLHLSFSFGDDPLYPQGQDPSFLSSCCRAAVLLNADFLRPILPLLLELLWTENYLSK